MAALMELLRMRAASENDRGPGGRVLLALALVSSAGSCFDGADALGLPCRSDDDCGKGQRCEQSVCGGPVATGTTTEASSGSSSSTGTESTEDSTATESTGVVGGCGNGLLEPELGEACDPGTGLDAPGCNADCTMALCGDGYVNQAAGEDCEDDNDSDLDECTSDCRQTLFWDDMEDPMASMQWMVEHPTWGPVGDEYMLLSGWQYGVPDVGAWNSGLYSPASGTTRLISPPIEFPLDPGMGFHYELRFNHRIRLDGNPMDLNMMICNEPFNGDGGVVWVKDGDELTQVGPPMGHPEALSDQSCTQPNPLLEPLMVPAVYAGISPPSSAVTLLLPEVEGKVVQLVFEIGYDCFNCWVAAPLGAGWTLFDVVVAPFPD